MRLPDDTPKWVETVFRDLEEDVDNLVAKSQTADAAMKAAGAYWLWNKIKSEATLEISRQETREKQRIDQLHARRNSDA